MKNILVAVDFSDTSAAALRFGTYLAEVMDFNLRVVHVFDASFSLAQVISTGALLAEKGRLEQQLSQFVQKNAFPVMATFQGNLETLPAVMTEVFEGYPTQVLRALSESSDTAYVIMGGVGAGTQDHPPSLFGSVAKGTALHSGSPTILIPRGYGYPTIKKIALAFENQADLSQIGGPTKDLIRVLRPEVHFVHVANEQWERSGLSKEDISATLGNDFTPRGFKYHTLPEGPVGRRLIDFAAMESIDLLVLGHRQQGTWEGLFSGSRAKPVVRHSNVPLMVVPFN